MLSLMQKQEQKLINHINCSEVSDSPLNYGRIESEYSPICGLQLNQQESANSHKHTNGPGLLTPNDLLPKQMAE
jgi:proteasome lid subunit RPN8/RPN11